MSEVYLNAAERRSAQVHQCLVYPVWWPGGCFYTLPVARGLLLHLALNPKPLDWGTLSRYHSFWVRFLVECLGFIVLEDSCFLLTHARIPGSGVQTAILAETRRAVHGF